MPYECTSNSGKKKTFPISEYLGLRDADPNTKAVLLSLFDRWGNRGTKFMELVQNHTASQW